MNLRHTAGEAVSQVAPGQMNIEEGGGQIAVPGEGRNGMEFPAGAGQISQAEMPQRMGTEAGNVSAQRNATHDLGPGPQGNRRRAIAWRFGEEEWSTGAAEHLAMHQVCLEQDAS